LALSGASVALRSLVDLAIDEISIRDVTPPPGTTLPLTVIRPRFDVHSIYTVYPAFVRNRMAYGWMCAADVINPPADAGRAAAATMAADEIHRLRHAVARVECWRAGQPVPPMMVTLPAGDSAVLDPWLAAAKGRIRDQVAARIAAGGAVPAGTGEWDNPATWSSRREIHPWDPFTPPRPDVLVPDVRELNRAAADRAIADAGLVAAYTGATTNPSFVVSQNPAAGRTVPQGSTVILQMKAGLPP
jgi:hypothetical protein